MPIQQYQLNHINSGEDVIQLQSLTDISKQIN